MFRLKRFYISSMVTIKTIVGCYERFEVYESQRYLSLLEIYFIKDI